MIKLQTLLTPQKVSRTPKILSQFAEMRLKRIFEEDMRSENPVILRINDAVIKKISRFLSGEMKRSCAIGIAGETASGKSTITLDIIDTINAFAQEFELENAVTRINTDDYYYDRSDMVKKAGSFAEFAKHYDLDVPEALELELMHKHIKQLVFGHEVLLPEYDMSGTAIRRDSVKPAKPSKVIISEGLFTLTEKVADAFDLKIYVDVRHNVQKDRFYKRALERHLGDSADEVYKNASDKAKIYIKPTMKTADIVISGEADRHSYKKLIAKILCFIQEQYFNKPV